MENKATWFKGFTFKKDIARIYKNQKGNEFAIINLGKNAEGKSMYFNASTKLISHYNMAKDGEHKFEKSNLAEAPFIAIAYPSDQEMNVSIKEAEGKFSQEKLSPADVKKVLKDMTTSTSEWIEKAKLTNDEKSIDEQVAKVNSEPKKEEVKPADVAPEEA